MWETISSADIERAKHALQQTRDRVLERQQAEIKTLDMDANFLRNLEAGLKVFHQRFISPPISNQNRDSPVMAAIPVLPNDAPTVEQSPARQTEIESPKPLSDGFGPNFGRV